MNLPSRLKYFGGYFFPQAARAAPGRGCTRVLSGEISKASATTAIKIRVSKISHFKAEQQKTPPEWRGIFEWYFSLRSGYRLQKARSFLYLGDAGFECRKSVAIFNPRPLVVTITGTLLRSQRRPRRVKLVIRQRILRP